jgi:hypothetical protein
MGPSSDIAIRENGRVVRHIEVTSVAEPLWQTDGIIGALEHVLRKAANEKDGGSHEGAMALNWADEVDPGALLRAMAARLNNPQEHHPVWRRAARHLDRLVLESYGPVDPPQVYATLTRDGGRWHVEIGPFLPPEPLDV